MQSLKTNVQRQTGAALTEFVVVAVVLTPLMFGIPMIGKMLDLKQTTVQASRYAAWETTVSAVAPTQNLDQRFYSDSSTPIGDTPAGPNTLWGPAQSTSTDSNATLPAPLGGYQSDTAVVVNAGAAMGTPSAYDAGVSNGIQYAPAASKKAAHRVGKAVDALGVIADRSGGDWDNMDTDGLIRGQASATMQGNGWLDPLTFTEGTVIMNDNWSVAGAVESRDRVRSLVPAGALDNAGKIIGNLGRIPGIRELKYFRRNSGRGVFGYVDVEPLPPSEDLAPRPLKDYEQTQR